MTRECCCSSAGRRLCAVHWLQRLKATAGDKTRLFSFSKQDFLFAVRAAAQKAGYIEHARLGTHSFRRGMAQDIVDSGSPLSVLLRAGEWNSKAFLACLRQAQPQEAAIAQAVIYLSDSEDEGN